MPIGGASVANYANVTSGRAIGVVALSTLEGALLLTQSEEPLLTQAGEALVLTVSRGVGDRGVVVLYSSPDTPLTDQEGEPLLTQAGTVLTLE